MTLDVLLAAWSSPTYALPLDMFRVLVGVLSFAYFLRTLHEAPNFSSPQGLLDHALTRRLFAVTRLSLFHPGMSLALFRAIFVLGCLGSWLLILGYWVKPVALFLYLVVVSIYRWNFLVMYVDDAIMHLSLFWILVLPVGNTLILQDWIRDNAASFERWQTLTVSGFAMRCFLLNLALVYVVAGLWKWTSRMWRNGTALYAIQKMAVSRVPGFWKLKHLPLLKAANYFALVVEPLLALIVFIPSGSAFKWALLAAAFTFHLGIVATMKIPFANLAMIGAMVIVFRDEIMQRLGAATPPGLDPISGPPSFSDLVALGLVLCLTLMFVLDALFFSRGLSPALGTKNLPATRWNPLYAPLWALGIAQSYRLFDWIDARNYQVSYDIVEIRPDSTTRRIDPHALFPVSIRHTILQSYLFGNIWVQSDPACINELRPAIFTGYAQRYCQSHAGAAQVEVYATVRRITFDNLDLHRGVRMLMMKFTSQDGKAGLEYHCLTPPAFD